MSEQLRTAETIQLPRPVLQGTVSVEESLSRRRSLREFAATPLTLAQISQLCWAAQGQTHAGEYRTAPSAGAIFPFTVLVAAVDGVFEYGPHDHTLHRRTTDDVRLPLQRASLDQPCVGTAALDMILVCDSRHMEAKYGDRAETYCLLEAGHIAQNVLLEATALRLGGVPVGAFHERQVTRALRLGKPQQPRYLVALGHPRSQASS